VRTYSPAGVVARLGGVADRLRVRGFSYGLRGRPGPVGRWRRLCCTLAEGLAPSACEYLVVTGRTPRAQTQDRLGRL
jgi:hypothetical protein